MDHLKVDLLTEYHFRIVTDPVRPASATFQTDKNRQKPTDLDGHFFVNYNELLENKTPLRFTSEFLESPEQSIILRSSISDKYLES